MAMQLQGTGVEFGALMAPTPLPDGASARYADHRTTEELRARYSDLDVVPVDIVLRSDDLSEIEDGSCDFLIANQVIEHLPNPLGAIETWGRKLKSDGTMFLGYPLGKYCPDRVRPITAIDHLIEDYNKKTSDTCNEHALAFAWAWESHQFADSDNIHSVLKELWSTGRTEMLEQHFSMIKNAQDLKRVREIVANRQEEVHHHVFDTQLVIDAFAAIEEKSGLYPSDFSSGRGLLNEEILIFRRRRDPSFASRLEAEHWVHEFIVQQQDYIRQQHEFINAMQKPA
ncbi:class I SAM-dependent methyltransferase [Methylorubrum extorquens]|uniref:class I SAM-dependent methyltransferase n=1 Tax=Methylorubrum extorquens TaxID=408 RepID=UPI002237F3C4|nr:class I SAM-dependent methyltransferase [Methylorubrum extorquens]UYW30162.1 class I SAM-dependent methyltransferase [Methylorubrum extorquens]